MYTWLAYWGRVGGGEGGDDALVGAQRAAASVQPDDVEQTPEKGRTGPGESFD